MAFRAVIFAALCILAAMRGEIVSAAEAPSNGGGDPLSAIAEGLSREELQAEAMIDQSRLLDSSLFLIGTTGSAQPTVQSNSAVAQQQYRTDLASAPCAEWGVIVLTFQDSTKGAGIIASSNQFFTYNRGIRPNPRSCNMVADRPANAEAVHLYPSVLAIHFYRLKATAAPTAYGRQHALDTVMYRSKICADLPGIDPNDMSAVAQCATRVFSRVESAPWAAFLIISPMFAKTLGASPISADLALIQEASKLRVTNSDYTIFYVLAK